MNATNLKIEKINGRRGEYAVIDGTTGRQIVVQPNRDMARDWLKALKTDPALLALYVQ